MHRTIPLLILVLAVCGCDKPEPTPPPTLVPDGTNTDPVPFDIPRWREDVSDAPIPIRSARGMLHGKEFRPDKVTFDIHTRKLTFRKGDAPQKLEIQLFLKQDERLLSVRREVFMWTTEGIVPHVYLWSKGKAGPVSTAYTQGYALKLRLGGTAPGRIGGELFLCLPDEDHSVLAGRFDAVVTRGK